MHPYWTVIFQLIFHDLRLWPRLYLRFFKILLRFFCDKMGIQLNWKICGKGIARRE